MEEREGVCASGGIGLRFINKLLSFSFAVFLYISTSSMADMVAYFGVRYMVERIQFFFSFLLLLDSLFISFHALSVCNF